MAKSEKGIKRGEELKNGNKDAKNRRLIQGEVGPGGICGDMGGLARLGSI